MSFSLMINVSGREEDVAMTHSLTRNQTLLWPWMLFSNMLVVDFLSAAFCLLLVAHDQNLLLRLLKEHV